MAIFMGVIFSHPQSSYYSIDLMTSLPSGPMGSSGGGAMVVPVAEQKPATPVAPTVRPPPATRAVPQDALKLFDKNKKKMAPVTPKSKSVTPQKVNPKSAAKALALASQIGLGNRPTAADAGNEGGGGGGGGGSGVGVMAEGGTPFPYPWYLKAIAEKLDKHWKPPQEFQSDTVAVIAFVIHRDGQVTGSMIEQDSGDSTFDQLALRAVLYSNPLPPLPTGFPDDTLRVHMKFVGKRT